MKQADFNKDIVFNENKPNITLILESEASKEIRIAMRKGQIMKEHKTAFPIVVHILSGEIDFEVEGKKHELKQGAILSLKPNVPHSLVAQEDSIVRLSLAKKDTVFRVKSVIENKKMGDKKELLKQIMTALAKGDKQTADKFLKIFMDYVPEITAEEVTQVAQQLDDEGVFKDSAHHMSIEQNVFGIIDTKMVAHDLNSFPEGHPVHTFLAENKVIKELCNRAKELIKDRASFETLYTDWVLLAKQFLLLNIHYLRKENQLFPFLEKRGFSHPSTIMWSIHDAIRSVAKQFTQEVENKEEEKAYETLENLAQIAYEMTIKEEKILLPKSSKLLTQEDWVKIREGEDEIGWCYIEKPIMWNPNWKHPSESGSAGTTHRQSQNSKVAPKEFDEKTAQRNSSIGGLNLEVGSITPEQINLIFKHLPFDVTFVDEFDEVRYYNKGEERVFPRSPGIIGRQVKFCHPPKSVHMVEQIVEAFKKGERNEANFWINFQGKFVYIQYFAVRDNQGNYKGVLEITYDATTVRNLEGEQRLLDWE